MTPARRREATRFLLSIGALFALLGLAAYLAVCRFVFVPHVESFEVGVFVGVCGAMTAVCGFAVYLVYTDDGEQDQGPDTKGGSA